MNRAARRAAAKGHRRPLMAPDQHWQRQTAETMLEDVYVNTRHCRHGRCGAPATRWYLRTDLEDRRLVIYPTCAMHLERAEAAACPGQGCFAPDEDHYVAEHVDLVPQLEMALEAMYGVGFPFREDWDRLDVIRPLA